jgi:hypothetical protein
VNEEEEEEEEEEAVVVFICNGEFRQIEVR